MKTFIFPGFQVLKASLLSALVAVLFLCATVSAAYAISPPTKADVQTAFDQAQVDFEEFFDETQESFSTKVKETQTALKNLPSKLEDSAFEIDAKHRQAVLDDLQAAQDKLAETEASYAEYAKRTDELEKELISEAKQSRADLKAGSEQKVKDVKESLRLTSDAIGVLSDDLEKAISDTSTFSKVRFEQHTKALQDALNTSNKALKTLFR